METGPQSSLAPPPRAPSHVPSHIVPMLSVLVAVGALGWAHYARLTAGAPALEPGHHSRNVCVFANGEVDRSATGSGVSARAALHYAKGELGLNQKITIESIIGSTMTVQAVAATKFGPHDAVVPEVSGTAAIIGRNEFYFDPADSLGRGFLLR